MIKRNELRGNLNNSGSRNHGYGGYNTSELKMPSIGFAHRKSSDNLKALKKDHRYFNFGSKHMPLESVRPEEIHNMQSLTLSDFA